MAHGKNSNPDTEALGLDVDTFVGRPLDEIRSLLAAHGDVALIVGHEPVPAGWPEEIVAPDTEENGLSWSYRSVDGTWRDIFLFGAARRSPSDPIPAIVYTRRPVDPSEATVRPIVQILFRADGTCQEASASAAEDIMILALKEARRARLPLPSGSKPVRPLAESRSRSPIEDLEQVLGLPPPAVCVDAEDFITESDGRLVLGVAPSEQPAFVVYDAGRNPRLVAFVAPQQPPQLVIRTDLAEWPPLEIGPGGLRVLPRCGMESDETALDFYALREAGHRVIDPSGAARSVLILMVAGPCFSTAFPDANLVARVVVLASPETYPSAEPASRTARPRRAARRAGRGGPVPRGEGSCRDEDDDPGGVRRVLRRRGGQERVATVQRPTSPCP